MKKTLLRLLLVFTLVFTMIYFFFNRPAEDVCGSESYHAAPTSRDLHKGLNEERRKKGLSDIPEINNTSGTSTGNLARKDKTYRNVPEFFIQLFSQFWKK